MIKIDTSDLHILSKRLNEVHRAVFPNSVRECLNEAAFDVKKTTLLQSANNNFEVRRPEFFKKYSGVEKAIGWDIDKMKSTVGMIPSGKASIVVGNMEQQESGGDVKSKLVTDDLARQGEVHKGIISKNRYVRNINKIATVEKGDKNKLIREVTGLGIRYGGKGKGNAIMYGKILYEISGFKRLGPKIKLHFIKLYAWNKSGHVTIKPTHFMKEAGLQSGNKIPQYFYTALSKQLKKHSK